MDAYVIVALLAAGLLLAEAVLPTGGLLGAIGVGGLFAAGIIGLAEGGTTADVIGGALIAVAIVAGIGLWFVARKVYAVQRNNPPKMGPEEMIGGSAEARTGIGADGGGQVFTRGTLWAARLAAGAEPVRAGDKVIVEAVDGLTLVVRPQPQPVQSR
ncbi:MAG TPA: NfeD family protein [Solirubrobacterales bacterium]|jgi:membrane-bound ClpP family serine protease